MAIEVRQIGSDTWELVFITSALPDRVFEYVADFERHVDWEDDLASVQRVGGTPGREGAKYVKSYGDPPRGLAARLFAKQVKVDCVLDHVDTPHRLDWRQNMVRGASDGYNFQRFSLTLVPDARGCRCVLVRRVDPADAITMQMAGGAMGWMAKRMDDAQPDRRAELERVLGVAGGEQAGGLSREQMVGRMLQGVRARGPGSSSLERLMAITDAW